MTPRERNDQEMRRNTNAHVNQNPANPRSHAKKDTKTKQQAPHVESKIHHVAPPPSDYLRKRAEDCATMFNKIQSDALKAADHRSKFSEMNQVEKLAIKGHIADQLQAHQKSVYLPGEGNEDRTITVKPRSEQGIVDFTNIEKSAVVQMASASKEIRAMLDDKTESSFYIKKSIGVSFTMKDGIPVPIPQVSKFILVTINPSVFVQALEDTISDFPDMEVIAGCRPTTPLGNLKLVMPTELYEQLTHLSSNQSYFCHKKGLLAKTVYKKLWAYLDLVEKNGSTLAKRDGYDKFGNAKTHVIIPTEDEIETAERAYCAASEAYEAFLKQKNHYQFIMNKQGDDSTQERHAATEELKVAEENFRRMNEAHELKRARGDMAKEVMEFSPPEYQTLTTEERELYIALRKKPEDPLYDEYKIRGDFYRIVRSWHEAREKEFASTEAREKEHKHTGVIHNLIEIMRPSTSADPTKMMEWFDSQLKLYQYMEHCIFATRSDPTMLDDKCLVNLNVTLKICNSTWFKNNDSSIFIDNSTPVFFDPQKFMYCVAKLKSSTAFPSIKPGAFSSEEFNSVVKTSSSADFKRCVDHSITNVVLLLLSSAVLPFESAVLSKSSLQMRTKAKSYSQALCTMYDNQLVNIANSVEALELMKKIDSLNLVASIKTDFPQYLWDAECPTKRIKVLLNMFSHTSVMYMLHELCFFIKAPTGEPCSSTAGHFAQLAHRVMMPRGFSKDAQVLAGDVAKSRKPGVDKNKHHAEEALLAKREQKLHKEEKHLKEERGRYLADMRRKSPRSNSLGNGHRGRTPDSNKGGGRTRDPSNTSRKSGGRTRDPSNTSRKSGSGAGTRMRAKSPGKYRHSSMPQERRQPVQDVVKKERPNKTPLVPPPVATTTATPINPASSNSVYNHLF